MTGWLERNNNKRPAPESRAEMEEEMKPKNFCENCGENISHTAEKLGGHLNFCSQRCWEQALVRKILSQIEDRLRKNTEDVFAVARFLGVSEEF